MANRKRDLRINEQAIRCADVLLLMFTILRKSVLEGELKYQITSHNSSTCILYDLTTCTHIYIHYMSRRDKQFLDFACEHVKGSGNSESFV